MATSDAASTVDNRTDPERLLCPQHHHDCWDQSGPTVYCKSCGHSYRYQDCIDPVGMNASPPNGPTDSNERPEHSTTGHSG